MMSAHIDQALGRTVRTGVHIGNALLLLVQQLFMCHVVPLFDGNHLFTMSFVKGKHTIRFYDQLYLGFYKWQNYCNEICLQWICDRFWLEWDAEAHMLPVVGHERKVWHTTLRYTRNNLESGTGPWNKIAGKVKLKSFPSTIHSVVLKYISLTNIYSLHYRLFNVDGQFYLYNRNYYHNIKHGLRVLNRNYGFMNSFCTVCALLSQILKYLFQYTRVYVICWPITFVILCKYLSVIVLRSRQRLMLWVIFIAIL